MKWKLPLLLLSLIGTIGLAYSQDEQPTRRRSHGVAPITSSLDQAAARAYLRAHKVADENDYEIGRIILFKAYDSGGNEAVGAVVELQKNNNTGELALFLGSKSEPDQWIEVPREQLAVLQTAAERCK